MCASGVKAILVKVASLGLDRRHLGKSLQEVKEHLLECVRMERLTPILVTFVPF